jgi:tetratricopeptide (TPR) repeat protein
LVYSASGEYVKAQKIFEHNIAVCSTLYKIDDTDIIWPASHLGVIYEKLGKHNKAINILTKNLITYEQIYGARSVKTAKLLNNMREVYLLHHDMQNAEASIQRAYDILKIHHHLEAYKSLELLGDMYLTKFYGTQQQQYKDQAIRYFQILFILRTHIFRAHQRILLA